MRKPPTLVEAAVKGLLTDDGVRATFSNGTEGDGWMSGNCHECRFYDAEGTAGEMCAFEATLMLNNATAELAEMFGWARNEEYPECWDAPHDCPFRRSDSDDDAPPPPPPDPRQLVLLADPTEDAALIRGGQVRELAPTTTPEEAR